MFTFLLVRILVWSLAWLVLNLTSKVFMSIVIARWLATTLYTYWSTFGAPCQYVSFLLRMTWSPLRHSENLNEPLNTVGAVFSAALSKSSGFDVAVTYLPKTCVGSV